MFGFFFYVVKTVYSYKYIIKKYKSNVLLYVKYICVYWSLIKNKKLANWSSCVLFVVNRGEILYIRVSR